MNLTFDANIWVGYFDPKDSQHSTCIAMLDEIYHNPAIKVFSPYLMEVEVLGSIARKFRDKKETVNVKEVMQKMRFIPRHKWLSLDTWLAAEASHCATTCYLSGSDAVYVATALIYKSTLITYDKEMIQRASSVLEVLTPNEWLEKQGVIK